MTDARRPMFRLDATDEWYRKAAKTEQDEDVSAGGDARREPVTRYTAIQGDENLAYPRSWGEFVLYEDYRALADRLAVLEQQRIKYGPICLNCGKAEPCMTDEEAAQHGASIPCTFEPSPRAFFDRCKQLEQRLAEVERQRDEALVVKNAQLTDAQATIARLEFTADGLSKACTQQADRANQAEQQVARLSMELHERAKDCIEHCQDQTRSQLGWNQSKRQVARMREAMIGRLQQMQKYLGNGRVIEAQDLAASTEEALRETGA